VQFWLTAILALRRSTDHWPPTTDNFSDLSTHIAEAVFAAEAQPDRRICDGVWRGGYRVYLSRPFL